VGAGEADGAAEGAYDTVGAGVAEGAGDGAYTEAFHHEAFHHEAFTSSRRATAAGAASAGAAALWRLGHAQPQASAASAPSAPRTLQRASAYSATQAPVFSGVF